MASEHIRTWARRRWGRAIVGILAIGLPAALAMMPASPASAAPGDRMHRTDGFPAGDATVGTSQEHHVVIDAPKASLRPMLAGVTVDAYAKCIAGGVSVTNNSGTDIEVRLYLNGAPAFLSNSWIAVPNGQSSLISGEAPAAGSTYELFQRGPGDTEVSLGTATYTPPDYCGAYAVTFTDTCDNVTVTVASSYGSDAVFGISQTSGNTYPVVEDFAVPAGQTSSVDVPITADIHELGLYFPAESDYLAFYQPKGPGNCNAPEQECGTTTLPETTAPPTEPTTTPPPTDPTTSTVLIADTTTTTTTTTEPTPPLVSFSVPLQFLTTTTQPVPRLRGAAGEARPLREMPAAVPCPGTPDDPGTPGSTPSTPGGMLPATGSSTATVALLAAVLLFSGGAALAVARRRTSP